MPSAVQSNLGECRFVEESVAHINKLFSCIARNMVEDQIAKEESTSRFAASIILGGTGCLGTLASLGFGGWALWTQDVKYLTGLAAAGATAVAGFTSKYFFLDRPTQFERMTDVWAKISDGFFDNDGDLINEGVRGVLKATRENPKEFYKTIKGINQEYFIKTLHHFKGVGCMLKAASLAEKEDVDLNEIKNMVNETKKHMERAGVNDISLETYAKGFLDYVQACAVEKEQQAAKDATEQAVQEAAPAA